MIILNLIVSSKEQIDAIVNSILRNKFAIQVVVGNAVDSYLFNTSCIKEHTVAYPIQFVTKSMLFSEIEASLKKEFPQTDFYICATPIVLMAINFHNKIKKRVVGSNLIGKETEN